MGGRSESLSTACGRLRADRSTGSCAAAVSAGRGRAGRVQSTPAASARPATCVGRPHDRIGRPVAVRPFVAACATWRAHMVRSAAAHESLTACVRPPARPPPRRPRAAAGARPHLLPRRPPPPRSLARSRRPRSRGLLRRWCCLRPPPCFHHAPPPPLPAPPPLLLATPARAPSSTQLCLRLPPAPLAAVLRGSAGEHGSARLIACTTHAPHSPAASFPPRTPQLRISRPAHTRIPLHLQRLAEEFLNARLHHGRPQHLCAAQFVDWGRREGSVSRRAWQPRKARRPHGSPLRSPRSRHRPPAKPMPGGKRAGASGAGRAAQARSLCAAPGWWPVLRRTAIEQAPACRTSSMEGLRAGSRVSMDAASARRPGLQCAGSGAAAPLQIWPAGRGDGAPRASGEEGWRAHGRQSAQVARLDAGPMGALAAYRPQLAPNHC